MPQSFVVSLDSLDSILLDRSLFRSEVGIFGGGGMDRTNQVEPNKEKKSNELKETTNRPNYLNHSLSPSIRWIQFFAVSTW